MPTPISQLAEIPEADFTADDVMPVVDVDDVTSAPTGTTKKITKTRLFTNVLITTALKFADAVSKIIPGATSFSIRNHADDADNVLVADNGDVTLRSKLKFATAVSKLIPGATSFSLRNNADSEDNVLVSDAGAVTVRAALSAAEVRTSAQFTASGDGWSLKSHDGSKTYLQTSTSGALTVLDRLSTGGLANIAGDAAGHIFLDTISTPAAPASGAIWFDGTDLFIHVGSTTYKFNKTSV